MKTLKHLGITIVTLALLLTPLLPFLPKEWSFQLPWEPIWGNVMKLDQVGVYGDFVGGFIGTIAFMISVLILFRSYQNQKTTNKQMLADQETLHNRTAFESRFFELLKFHRENVAGIEVDTKTSRQVFVSLIREFRLALEIVKSVRQTNQLGLNHSQDIDLAYLAVYYGVGPNSTRLLKKATVHLPDDLTKPVIHELTSIQERLRNKKLGIVEGDESRNEEFLKWAIERLEYSPFDGHQSRLGHYYRHLWQMMKYVDAHAPVGRDQEYADIVRAQLSNHEQALLCLNSLSSVGAAWNKKDQNGSPGYVTRYGLIKNIPGDFFDPTDELNLKAEFPDIKFEYENKATDLAEPNRDTAAPST